MRWMKIFCLSILLTLATFLNVARPSPTPTPRSEDTKQGERGNDAIQQASTNHPSTAVAESDQQKTERIAQRNYDQDHAVKVSLSPVDVSKGIWDYVLIISTILLTAGLVMVGALQVKVARQSTEVSRLASQVNRPFLLVTEPIMTREERHDLPFSFLVQARVVLRNFGTGPADIIDFIIEIGLFDIPPPDPDPDYDAMEAGQLNYSLIAPGEIVNDRIPPASISLDGKEWELVQQEKKRIGIYGRIRYKGTTDQVYWTRFFWWRFPNAPYLARANEKKLNDHS